MGSASQYGSNTCRKAVSDTVKVWLQALIKSGVPILLCLTHADVLYLECQEDGVECYSAIDKELMVCESF